MNWTNAPDGIDASHWRSNTPQNPDGRRIRDINMIADHKGLRLSFAIPCGSGSRDVVLEIAPATLVDLSRTVQADVEREKDEQIAALTESRNALADRLYAIKQETEGYPVWSALHEAEKRAAQRAKLEAEAD